MGLFDNIKDAAKNAVEQKVQETKTSFGNAVHAAKFKRLEVAVRDGVVYDERGRQLGPLAGAQAELTDTVKKHRVGSAAVVGAMSLGAGAVIGLSRKKEAFGYVTFADGNFHEVKLKGKDEIQDAQREVAKFNAMARGAS